VYEVSGIRSYLKLPHKNLIIAANNRRFQEFEFSYSSTPVLTLLSLLVQKYED
jgi:hypothetical protein